jgi:hypothetical protein
MKVSVRGYLHLNDVAIKGLVLMPVIIAARGLITEVP